MKFQVVSIDQAEHFRSRSKVQVQYHPEGVFRMWAGNRRIPTAARVRGKQLLPSFIATLKKEQQW